jgi:hypothetical protein
MAKVLGFTIQIQGTEAAIENATDLKLAISEINKQLKQTTDASEYDRLEKQLIDLKARQKVVNAEIRETIKQRSEELTATSDAAGAYRQLSKQLTDNRKRFKDLAAAGQENSDAAKTLLKDITALDERLKEIDGSVGQFQRSVGDYRNAIKDAIPFIGSFSDGIEQIGKQTTRAGKAIATSFFIFEIINQLAQGIQAIGEFSEEFRKLQGDIQNITGETGQSLIDNTALVKALGDTYGETSQEITNAANAVSKEFGVSLEDSLLAIEAGFRKGANAQGQFLDQLREYGTQFREAGFELDQFIALNIRASQEGIYSDKGLDAVKEFGLRIREQTKATRTALNDAFGEEFTQELFTNLNNGSITTTEALAKVSTGLRDVDLTAEQTQTVIADVFGGPGEDAGLRYLQLLADIDQETQNVGESTTTYQAQQEELFKANRRLADAQAEVTNQLGNASAEIELLKVRGKTFLNEAAALILKFFDRLPAIITGVNAALTQFGKNLTAGFGLFGETGSITDAFKEGFEFQKQIIDGQNEVSKAAAEAAKEEAERQKAAEEADKIRKRRAKELSRQKAIDNQEEIKAAEKAEKARVKALERERADFEKQLSTLTNLRNETIKVALGAGSELVSSSLVQVENGFRLVTESLTERSAEILTRIKENTEKASQTDQTSLLTSIFGTNDPVEAADGLNNFLQGTVLPVVSAFNEKARQQALSSIDQQITTQEESIARLQEQAEQSTGIQREILKQKIVDEEQALASSTLKREKINEEFARKEKRISVLQAIVNTALAITKTLATTPWPANLITAAVVAAQGAAQVATINAQPLATGGLITGRRVTDRQNIPRQTNGDNVLATVKRGEVVLNQRQQAALGGSTVFRAIGVPGFAGGGIIAPPISAPILPQQRQSGQAEVLQLVKELKRGIEATNSRIDRIKTYVVSEEISSDLSEGEAIKTQATFE